MAEKGSNNWLWWSIGGIATLGLGLGIYYFVKANKEAKAEEEKKKQTSGGGGSTTYTPPVYTPPSPSPKPTSTNYPKKATPFKTLDESNAFRKWVNEKDPSFAKEIDLSIFSSKTSSINNDYIQKAFYKYGEEYLKSLQSSAQAAEQAGKSTSLQDVKNAIGGSIPVTDYGSSTKRFQIRLWDGSGNWNVYANFGDNGAFWIDGEKNGEKFGGSWYKKDGQFFITIDGKTNNDANLGGLTYAIAKEKLPAYFNNAFAGFNGNLGATKFGQKTEGTKLQDIML